MSGAGSHHKEEPRRARRGPSGRGCRCSCRQQVRAGHGCGRLLHKTNRLALEQCRKKTTRNVAEGGSGLTEWTQRRIREPVKVDVEVHTSSVRIRCARNVSTDTGCVDTGQDGGVGDAGWVSLNNGGIAKFACCSLGLYESKAAGGNGEEERGIHYSFCWWIDLREKKRCGNLELLKRGEVRIGGYKLQRGGRGGLGWTGELRTRSEG